ncbi:MAG: hypothetical protein R2681_14050 [Pyrinomonadaceae bacterium]
MLDLYDSPYLRLALEQTPVGDIWGVGRQNTKRLTELGINNALELSAASVEFIRKHLHTPGGRTVLELRGKKCIPFEKTLTDKRSIAHTRSFGEALTGYTEMRNAILNFGTRAVERIRRDKLAAKSVTVFMQTNRFKEKYASSSITYDSIYHSNLKNEISKWVSECFEKIYIPNLKYKKAGVILSGLVNTRLMSNRLYDNDTFKRWTQLADVMDELNYRYGRDTLKLANLADLGRGKSSREYMNKNADLPDIDPLAEANTSEFRRFI